MEFGIVQYFGNYDKNKCSYCNSIKKTSESAVYTGMTTYNLNETSYQWLIDRGWRRSGTYCYKMVKTDCCAFYTIRCDALKFELTKSKRKTLKKMYNFLKSDSLDQALIHLNKKKKNSSTNDSIIDYEFSKNKGDLNVDFNLNNIESTNEINNSKIINSNLDNKSIQKTKLTNQFNSIQQTNKSINLDQLKQSNKSKSKRILKCFNRIKNKFNCDDDEAINLMIKNRKSNLSPNNQKLSLEDYFKLENNLNNKLKIKIVLANSESGEQSHELYKKYQKIIHKSKDNEIGYKSFERFLISNPFPKLKTSAEWNNFDDNELPNKYGCYHMQYWLNDKLIGVNVIDILPNCLSSVYFFYDPDYASLNLGTYSSLREIELVRKLNKYNSNIKYYYMGFYINSCIKMKYKGNISPSYLLCPETFKWIDFKWCKETFDLNKTNRLILDKEILDLDSDLNIDDVKILFNHTIMTYKIYRKRFKSNLTDLEMKSQRDEIEEYAKYVGRRFVNENLIYLT